MKREQFKARLKKAIDDATPKPRSESEAKKVMQTGAATASNTLRGQLGEQRDAAADPMKSAAAADVSPSTQPAAPAAQLDPEQVGPAPAPVSAAPVVPAPLPAGRLDYSSDRAPTEDVMAQNNITKEQLAKGNEPAFGPTLEARADAEKHEASAEGQYRGKEADVRENARGAAANELARGLGGVHGARALQVGQVTSQQSGTRAKDAAERQRITATVTNIKETTRRDVESILSSMESEATSRFEQGLGRAERAYETTFEDAKGGIGTWLTTWGDDWEKLIEESLATARLEYLRQVDIAIDEVANLVETKLDAAKRRVADGKRQLDAFVAGLDVSVRRFGEEAREAVQGDFDAMTEMIDQRRDALIDKLTQQYKSSFERMSAMEERLREENKSLWQRVYDATVGLIKKILAFKDMLLGILGRAASVVLDILADPIGFLGNLVSGVMQGLKRFMSNIGTHLKKGLMDWIFGALGAAGLKLPDNFDLKGIISIVLQVLGLTYANFRARAVKIVGEPTVAALEKTAEVFKIMLTEGPGGLFRLIKDKLSDLKSMVLDAIFDFIKERVIMAGITWIIGLLNPASAFFKACKAIFDIVMFFINRGSQIITLVNAVIDSVAAIARGSLGAAATFVENALAKAIPVAIGFLASLLGIGDPAGTVRKTIEKAQSPVNKAIDFVIHQAVRLVKVVGNFAGKLLGKKDKGAQVAARGEAGHIAIAQEVGAKLIDMELPEGSTKEAIQAMRPEAARLSTQFGKQLEPGMRLHVEFPDAPAPAAQKENAQEEIKFDVIIAPNTTKVSKKKILNKFQAAEAGIYSVLEKKEKNEEYKDGTKRHAHHAPPVLFAEILGTALENAAAKLAPKLPKVSEKLRKAGNALTKQGITGAPKLSAILVHEHTHKVRGGQARIHGSEIQDDLLARLTEDLTPEELADVTRTKKDKIVVAPQTPQFQRQFREVAGASTDAKLTEVLATKGKGTQILRRFYKAEEARSITAVEVALSKSKKDGTKAERDAAVAELKTKAAETWQPLIDDAEFK